MCSSVRQLCLNGIDLDQEPWVLDELMRRGGLGPLAGVDEAGRGPLAGPVVAAAVVLPAGARLEGLKDSKLLSPKRREELFHQIQDAALCFGLGVVEAEEIDTLRILAATRKAMERAVAALDLQPRAIIIDGPIRIAHPALQFPLIKGDRKSHSVSAASVLAKVTRDRIMEHYHDLYPHYGFHRHKGYCTKEHITAINRYGPCPIHRKTFRKTCLGHGGSTHAGP